jgi:hypothetical protein
VRLRLWISSDYIIRGLEITCEDRYKDNLYGMIMEDNILRILQEECLRDKTLQEECLRDKTCNRLQMIRHKICDEIC